MTKTAFAILAMFYFLYCSIISIWICIVIFQRWCPHSSVLYGLRKNVTGRETSLEEDIKQSFLSNPWLWWWGFVFVSVFYFVSLVVVFPIVFFISENNLRKHSKLSFLSKSWLWCKGLVIVHAFDFLHSFAFISVYLCKRFEKILGEDIKVFFLSNSGEDFFFLIL